MDKMDDDKFKSIWGQDLFNYAYAKSQEFIGYPEYNVMMAAAIGKLNDDTQRLLKAQVNTSGVLGG